MTAVRTTTRIDAAVRRALGGFSLLELVMILAIVATIAAIAAPRYTNSLFRYRAESAARRVVADLALAQQTAMTTSSSRTVTFDTGTHSYTIPGVRALDGTGVTYTVSLLDPPYEARIFSVSLGGDAAVTFDGYGLPDSDGTVVIEVGDVQMTVALEATTGTAAVQ